MVSDWLEINVAPQAVLSPWRAAGLPSMIAVGSPVAMVVMRPWPFLGQVTLSPTRAMPLPSQSLVCDAEMTTPPWEV